MQDILDTLVHLDPTSLHKRAADASKRYAAAAWELAACLVAMGKSEAFRAFDCASVVEYAERQLGLGYHKALELLRGGRLLERCPKLSQACRDGRLCWAKVRELSKVETLDAQAEEMWLDFAVSHSSRELERAVAIPPRQFRRQETESSSGVQSAPQAAAEPSPAGAAQKAVSCSATTSGWSSVTPDEQASASIPEQPRSGGATAATKPTASASPRPAPPRLVKLELYLTADQFVIVDTAIDRIRSEKGRGVSREVAAVTMASHYLAGGDSRTRTNHPVVLRVDPASGTAYYETSRGILPASAAAVDDALARERGSFVAVQDVDTASRPPEQGADRSDASGESDAEKPAGIPVQLERPVLEDETTPAVPRPQGRPDLGEPRGRQDVRPQDFVAAPSASGKPGDPDDDGSGPPRRPGRREPIPAAVRRAALARAGYRCERCGATTRLEVDHTRAVCDGGTHRDGLVVRCHDCHQHRHAEDFAADSRYVRGRAAGLARRGHPVPKPDG